MPEGLVIPLKPQTDVAHISASYAAPAVKPLLARAADLFPDCRHRGAIQSIHIEHGRLAVLR